MLKITPRTQRVFIDLSHHANYSRHAINKGLDKVGEIVTKEATKGIMSPPKTGNTYIYRGRVHRASASGQYPAHQTGKLVRGINKNRITRKLIIGSKAPYSTFLEKGTKKMRKRPFLIRAISDTSSEQLRALIDEMDRRIK